MNDERICNILSELGILERYVKETDVEKINLNKEINYSVVTQKRMQFAEAAVADLMNAIET